MQVETTSKRRIRAISITDEEIDAFWRRVQKSDTCWAWPSLGKNGYGQWCSNKKWYLAHRVAWVISFGQIPERLLVLHRCDNPACVRPSHLFLGTDKDNAIDCFSKGRRNPPRGERHGRSKLSAAQVCEIRRRISTGQSIRSLSYEFGVSRPAIDQIRDGITWKSV